MPDFDARKVAEIHQQLHRHLPSDSALRVKALETLLVDKGLVNPQTIDAWVEAYTEEIGPKRGARVVAKAWRDPEFKTRLMQDAPAAIDELGYLGKATAHLQVVENTDDVHNLVVCTLCSCYPFSILGIAPRLVQGRGLPLTRGTRPARGAYRVWRRSRRRCRGACMG